jgi:hypothetical protein
MTQKPEDRCPYCIVGDILSYGRPHQWAVDLQELWPHGFRERYSFQVPLPEVPRN